MTEVFPLSSSEARLPSPLAGLLPVLMRELLRGGRPIMALMGRGRGSGDTGGDDDAAMAGAASIPIRNQKLGGVIVCRVSYGWPMVAW